MKLRLPSSLEGGLGIFAILLAITLVELYVVKKANQASIFSILKANGPAQFACLGIGGKWREKAGSKDPCCILPQGTHVVTDNVPVCLDETLPL